MQARRRELFHDLNKFQIVKFLNAYKRNCCLWDVTHRDYRNCNVRIEAWNKLLKIYQEGNPFAGRFYIRKIVNQIRQTYLRLRKIMLEDPTYVPKLWYYRYLDFLASQVIITFKKPVESAAGDNLNEDEETQFNKSVNNLLMFLPYDERPNARNLITEITKRAKMRHTGALKLSMTVSNNDVILIPNQEPICSTSRPSFSGVTPEELERQDTTAPDPAVIVIDDSVIEIDDSD